MEAENATPTVEGCRIVSVPRVEMLLTNGEEFTCPRCGHGLVPIDRPVCPKCGTEFVVARKQIAVTVLYSNGF